jgi:hypothetical protein
MAATGVVCSLACGHSGFDPKKFDAVHVAAESVRADLNADRLRLFGSEISLAQGRVTGGEEKAALDSYAQAAEAYKYLLRFREMDPDAPGGMVLLRGANRPIAMRYGIPIEERGGGRWVSKKAAMETFAAKADAALEDARRRTSVLRH